MRTGAGFTSINNASPAATPSVQQHDTWHSPVPYLFGGLAAMLGLIGFALLILACSYWRLSNYLDDAGDDGESDHREGDGKQEGGDAKPPPCFGEGFVVIMAGDQKPTFLATPISTRASSFGDGGKDIVKDERFEDGKVTASESEVSEQSGDRNPEQ